MNFICHIHNYTEYNQQWNVFSAFSPSKCTHTWSSGQPTQAAPGEQLGVQWLAQGSHLSRGQFPPESRLFSFTQLKNNIIWRKTGKYFLIAGKPDKKHQAQLPHNPHYWKRFYVLSTNKNTGYEFRVRGNKFRRHKFPTFSGSQI